MKKILFSLLTIGLILNIVNVSAENCSPDKVTIESISIEEKNDHTEELEEATPTGNNIKLNLSMSEVGDNITYKMVVKNASNEDYKLAENNSDKDTDYINYNFETEDKSNIVESNTSKTAYLRVEYKKEIPSELIENDSYKENKKITLIALDNEINNPNTKRNMIIIVLALIVIISTVSAAFLSLKNKKYIKPMIVIIGITLPVLVSALCEANIEIDLQLKIEKPCISFNDENSWEGIVNSIKNNKTECMNVGDTKTIDMGTLGTHTVRIANKSTPNECSQEGFSQTACGFVIEFADIINTHRMNPSSQGGSVDGDGNKGGWEHSEMRTYINNDIYNILPSELKTEIIDTKVISGYGSKDSENFTTTDKLYLLSTHEVWEDVDGDLNNGISFFDTGYNNTKQLDYYSNLGVTTSNYSGAIKQNNESTYDWWLRSSKNRGQGFLGVHSDGTCYRYTSSGDTVWVSPAFRIG